MNSPQLRDALTQQIKSTAQLPSKLLEKGRRLRDSTQSQARQNLVNPNHDTNSQLPDESCPSSNESNTWNAIDTLLNMSRDRGIWWSQLRKEQLPSESTSEEEAVTADEMDENGD